MLQSAVSVVLQVPCWSSGHFSLSCTLSLQSEMEQPYGVTRAAHHLSALAGQGAEELTCLISVMKLFSDV